MKGILLMMVLFVIAGVAMKSCNAMKPDLLQSVPGFGAAGKKLDDPTPKVAPGPVASAPASGPVVKKGPGFQMHIEKFRGFMGLTGTLRTDLGQYTPGRLCLHGLVEAVSDREARIRTTEGLVVVVAVDDYTRPEPPREEEDGKERKNSLAPDPVHVNAKPTDAERKIQQVFTAPPLPDVPLEQTLKLNEAQKRQVRAGIPISVPIQPAPTGTRAYQTQ